MQRKGISSSCIHNRLLRLRKVVFAKWRSKRYKTQACIFKVGDDLLPTDPERSIIEVVPNSRSRSQIGETTTDGGLYEIFQQDYGPVGSPGFQSAHENFIISSAGYVVASLLLQLKDRHNGNILIDRFSPQNDMLFCIKLSRSKW
ncbi:hypothetical protein L2E82_28758 [Cichorium intybus]|uniref:Uncharacterized protein n=1 Tax=Cichorium intybus TaxID=13427 RepID=A0ACB9CWQ4_CICIN|nr:hypothetical protein L2E82_28758 [Cichorium intybus]